MCACAWFWVFASVKRNARLEGESISIFAIYFCTIAGCSTVFETENDRQNERAGREREASEWRKDCSLCFAAEVEFICKENQWTWMHLRFRQGYPFSFLFVCLLSPPPPLLTYIGQTWSPIVKSQSAKHVDQTVNHSFGSCEKKEKNSAHSHSITCIKLCTCSTFFRCLHTFFKTVKKTYSNLREC